MKMIKFVAIPVAAAALVLLFQNCAGETGGSDLASSAYSCWKTVQLATDFRIDGADGSIIHLSGINTSMPSLQASTTSVACNAGNISSLPSFNSIKGYLTGLSLCTGNLGATADQIATDAGANNRADDSSVHPNGISYSQLKSALNQLIAEANSASICN